MLIFFDTEFTSLDWVAECLSIGMVTDQGSQSLYLGRSDVDRSVCSDFVITTVLPLFGQIPGSAMPYAEFGPVLRSWLERIPGPVLLVCDSGRDFEFLRGILGGRLPAHCCTEPLVVGVEEPEAWEAAIEAYFRANSLRGRHHALADAHACRAAFQREETRLG